MRSNLEGETMHDQFEEGMPVRLATIAGQHAAFSSFGFCLLQKSYVQDGIIQFVD